jgi:hypothetical protein
MTELPSFSPGETLTAAKLAAIVEAIKELQQVSSRGSSQGSGVDEATASFDPVAFVVNITGTAGEAHTATEQVPVSGVLEDFADSDRNCTGTGDPSAYKDIQGWENIPTGTKTLAIETQESDAFRNWVVHVPPPPGDQTGDTPYVLTYEGGIYSWSAPPDPELDYVFTWNATTGFTWELIEECE